MKNKFYTSILLISCFLLTGCPDDRSITYSTIKSVKPLLFSFQENGIYPYLDHFNREELGIVIIPDSTMDKRIYFSALLSDLPTYARSDPNEYVQTNQIDSVNIFTVYDFNENYPAGSKINEMLLYLDGMGDTSIIQNLSEQKFVSLSLKFSEIPSHDTLQFRVTGRITDEGTFDEKTELVILD
ncbi:hypothetical protein [Zunongwangia sp. HGR-M22]|uniref:hypothetical protein n=1 Tax=Zunongwangia sp. HGR-M22 TaxID=3015168 RepID=UPI0022DCE509|nr:hypothetical protein [Zunongwangia sp. HGR-M22]WBL27046.1 hypothetical protein PBT91_07185 [Zunongwangia sp. HGR-M22]